MRRTNRFTRWAAASKAAVVVLALVSPSAWASDARSASDEPSDVGPRQSSTAAAALLLGGLSLLLSIALSRLPASTDPTARRTLEANLRRGALALQEEDRRRIARELHDGAGQALTAARLQLTALRAQLGEPAGVDRIVRCVDEAIDEVRRSTANLSPPALAELGLRGALERHCASFAAGSALTVRCEVAEELPPLDDYLEVACYRIAQEGLHNAARHARASTAWIRIGASEELLRLEIGDDGDGWGEPPREGRGLKNIAERARLIGGKSRWVVHRGPGPRVEVTVPLERAPA